MDGAPFLGPTVAVDKAWTAAAYRLPTHVWAQVIQDPAHAQLAHIPRLIAVGGGYPIVEDGVVIGRFGLSGGSADQDSAVAEAALTQLGFTAA
ncbi:heme-binding protein [Streptomyces sp. 372A]